MLLPGFARAGLRQKSPEPWQPLEEAAKARAAPGKCLRSRWTSRRGPSGGQHHGQRRRPQEPRQLLWPLRALCKLRPGGTEPGVLGQLLPHGWQPVRPVRSEPHGAERERQPVPSDQQPFHDHGRHHHGPLLHRVRGGSLRKLPGHVCDCQVRKAPELRTELSAAKLGGTKGYLSPKVECLVGRWEKGGKQGRMGGNRWVAVWEQKPTFLSAPPPTDKETSKISETEKLLW